jgi:hypothetical protein
VGADSARRALVHRGVGWDRRDVPEQPTDAESNPYRMTLAQLEAEVRVPYEELMVEQPTPPAREASAEWDDEHRQLRLAGGA